MPISNPESERQFRVYGALEVKAAAKASLALLNTALRYGKNLEGELYADLLMAITHMDCLFALASETVTRLRSTKIEDRGYNAVDRVGFSGDLPCGSNCGDCGTCGSSGQTP